MFKIIRKLFSLLLALIIAVPGYAIFVTWKSAKVTELSKADAIVVLGAAQLNGTPGDVLRARLENARDVYKSGYAPLIITVGSGAPGDRTTEAAAGRYWLNHNGIKKSAVIEIPTGRDTRTQTISYAQALSIRKLSTVIIATDPYHCGRAVAIAEDNGISAQCAPVQSGPNSLENSRFRYLLRESGAYLAYFTLGKFGIHISDHLTNGETFLGIK
jgi:uncharacterized SAM-binding protein YcdF (DUF218 family)